MCRTSLVAVAVAAVVAVLAAPEAAAQAACACPTPKTQENFDAAKYLGDWYEMKRVPRTFEDDGQCGMAHYSWTDTSNSAVNVLNTNYVPKLNAVSSVQLLATPDDINNGKLTVTFPGLTVPGSKYWVLGTDYESYAVVYSCTEPTAATTTAAATITPHITLWVLSRTPEQYTAAVDKQAMALITDRGLDPSVLKDVVHQRGCPSDSCRACENAMGGVVDLAKLKGRWWEVQHSPYATNSDTQSCSMAEFVATSDGLTFNATTYEKSSDTAGADKSMLLEATWADATKKTGEFNIAKSAGKLCVLGTDYDSYAVVSICLPAPAAAATTTARPGPFAQPSAAASGGVFVLARKRGLSAAKQLEANKAVTNAGIPAASMQTTTQTPCPAAALVDASGSAAATAPAVLLVALFTAILALLRPAQ